MTIKLPSLNQPPIAYETDFVAWVDRTLELLQVQDYAAVDWEHLMDEFGDMSRRERQRLASNLVILLLHLLKWQCQPEGRSRSWQGSIVEHRRRIRQALQDSPSLQPYLVEVLAEAYGDAIEQAAVETGLAIEAFPVVCPYTIENLLDRQYLPIAP
jgi:hypothetical protein